MLSTGIICNAKAGSRAKFFFDRCYLRRYEANCSTRQMKMIGLCVSDIIEYMHAQFISSDGHRTGRSLTQCKLLQATTTASKVAFVQYSRPLDYFKLVPRLRCNGNVTSKGDRRQLPALNYWEIRFPAAVAYTSSVTLVLPDSTTCQNFELHAALQGSIRMVSTVTRQRSTG
jgi:hypothetical protein